MGGTGILLNNGCSQRPLGTITTEQGPEALENPARDRVEFQQGNSTCKGPEVGGSLAQMRKTKVKGVNNTKNKGEEWEARSESRGS